jgi:trimethylamine--corrinoid protein Co-methyltransferase
MRRRLEVLEESEVDEVHETSLRILEGTGVVFRHISALEELKEAGAVVDFEKGLVKFPQSLVVDAVAKAPGTVTLAGRTPDKDLVIGDGARTFFGTLGTAPLVRDLETRERRYATTEDLERFARIADGLESVRYFHTSVTPKDAKVETVDLFRWLTAFRNTGKHAMGAAAYNTDNLPYLMMMCEALCGGEEEMRRRPPITATECPVSPLQHDRRPLLGMMEFARNGLPVIVYSEPKAGATSPASLAGTLVISNCEVLSALVLIQQINPGAPVIYGSVDTLMDMRTGGIAFGSPETGLLAAATTQLSRRYGLPNMTPGGRTDSKVPCDAQTGYEKMRTALMVSLAGGSLGNMAGLIESNLTASYEQLIVDDEIIGSIERVAEGIDFSEEAVAESLISGTGPGGTYISKRHTMDRLRKEHYMPRLSDRSFYAGWERDGCRQLADAARDRAKHILATHEPDRLDEDVDRQLQSILDDAARANTRIV